MQRRQVDRALPLKLTPVRDRRGMPRGRTLLARAVVHRSLPHPSVVIPNRALADTQKSAAKRLVEKYIEEYGEDLKRVWAVERPFELHLPNMTIRVGRT